MNYPYFIALHSRVVVLQIFYLSLKQQALGTTMILDLVDNNLICCSLFLSRKCTQHQE